VTDELTDDLEHRRGRWSQPARQATATIACALAGVWLGVALAGHVPAPGLAGIGVAALVAGGVITATKFHSAGLAVALAGAGLAAIAIGYLDAGVPAARPVWWVLLTAAALLTLGNAVRRVRAAAIGASFLLGFLVLWVAVGVSPISPADAASVAAVVSLLIVGLLPRMVTITAGLTRLDDARIEDQEVARTTVAAAIDAAHRGLAVAMLAAAGSAALAGWTLSATPGAWTTALACLVVLVLLLRLRACPLSAEVAGLLAAAAAVLVGLGRLWARTGDWWGAPLLAAVVVVLGLGVLAYRPPKHVRARARQVADRVEATAVAALIPVAIGGFGVYANLLGLF
jgi:hypothetical protein